MAYIVSAYNLEKINLAPDTVTEDVLQNVSVILATTQFTVPLDRGLGLSQRYLGKPIQTAKAIIISEIMEAIETYEPRAQVEAVTFEIDEDVPGKLIPYVEVTINDE